MLERRERLAAPLLRLPVVELARCDCDQRSDVLEPDEHVRDLRRAAQLLVAALGEDAALDEAFFAGRVLGQAAFDAVVVREHQPAIGDERSRATGEPDDREPHAFEPRRPDVDAVLLRDGGARKVVEGPHPFIGNCRTGGAGGGD